MTGATPTRNKQQHTAFQPYPDANLIQAPVKSNRKFTLPLIINLLTNQ